MCAPISNVSVRALKEGRELSAVDLRPQREELNYFAGPRNVERSPPAIPVAYAVSDWL
jgi:hypothetical protein